MNLECRQCGYYHGRFYNGVWLNCAPYPNGIESDCPDFDEARSLVEKKLEEKQDLGLDFIVVDEAFELLSTPQQLLDWVEKNSGWQGDDLNYCLEIVKNSRTGTKF